MSLEWWTYEGETFTSEKLLDTRISSLGMNNNHCHKAYTKQDK